MRDRTEDDADIESWERKLGIAAVKMDEWSGGWTSLVKTVNISQNGQRLVVTTERRYPRCQKIPKGFRIRIMQGTVCFDFATVDDRIMLSLLYSDHYDSAPELEVMQFVQM